MQVLLDCSHTSIEPSMCMDKYSLPLPSTSTCHYSPTPQQQVSPSELTLVPKYLPVCELFYLAHGDAMECVEIV